MSEQDRDVNGAGENVDVGRAVKNDFFVSGGYI